MDFLTKVLVQDQYYDEEIPGTLLSFHDDCITVEFDHNIDHINSEVRLLMYHETMGRMYYEVRVSKFVNNRIWFIRPQIVEVYQSRNEFRVQYNVPLIVTKLLNAENQPVVLDKNLILRAEDLSASGIKVSSDLNLPVGIKMCLDLPSDDDKITCAAKIIRQEIRDDRYYYGCELILDKNSKDKIRKFVFKLQIDVKRKERKATLQVSYNKS